MCKSKRKMLVNKGLHLNNILLEAFQQSLEVLETWTIYKAAIWHSQVSLLKNWLHGGTAGWLMIDDSSDSYYC